MSNTIDSPTVRCNNCYWVGDEGDLKMFSEASEVLDYETCFFKGCPNCKTDDYLTDLE